MRAGLYSRRALARGFSLLELLVAMAILGMSLGLIYRASGSAARGMASVEMQSRATAELESLLAWRDTVPEGGWHDAGRRGGFDWRIDSAPWAGSLNDSRTVPLHEVQYSVSWFNGDRVQSLQVTTLLPQALPLAGQVR